jgi:pyrroline-5-carboxylate reductase
MTTHALGFIGGGRVTRIVLGGWKQANGLPPKIIVSDPDADLLAKLQAEYPFIEIAPGDNRRAAGQAVVFLAVHPPLMLAMLAELRGAVAPETTVVSFAPKFTLAKLAVALGGHAKLARVIPNAPSIIGAGYNPVTFAPALPVAAREALQALLAPLGDCPEVAEPKLEAYALLTGMGPTYLWFQLETLRELGRSFGLTDDDLQPALKRMACGAARTLLGSGLSPAQVMDLIPVKPLAEDEAAIKQAYQTRLPALFAKIKP